MDLMKISVMFYISLFSILVQYSDCTTHPRVKMYGPKGAVIDRREPAEMTTEPNVIDEIVNPIPQPTGGLLDEPSCHELLLMWRISQRQLAQSTNNNIIPISYDPFEYSTWEDYVKPRYINRHNSFLYERFLPDRIYYNMYRQLMPYEKIARMTTTTRSIVDDPLPRKATKLFRLDYPPSTNKLPIRPTSKDKFRELKDLMRHDKAMGTGVDNNGEAFAVISTPKISSNDTGKKRPGYYESMMTRPRHFSQVHHMNKFKPSHEEINNSLAATIPVPHVIIVLFF
ncbi:Hypothetical protein CINCED_3A012042 [Cinara cedri]|uniref:Uncharacterized protein n=1 Tax=Cinara cedri TaxID=506608 RepID=A0A5E4M8I6_9HEMI|nr:Hypothetical protein CINCED_3A012042 [Cinara cedri]